MKPEYIVLHHSATRDSGTVSWQAIRRWHVVHNGWQDIGYHFGIELVDDSGGLARQEILFGRMPGIAGAHAREAGMNRRGLGICCVGDFDLNPPPIEMLERTSQLVRWLMSVYQISRTNVIGHRDAGLMDGFDWRKGQYKSCPGKLFNLERFRERL